MNTRVYGIFFRFLCSLVILQSVAIKFENSIKLKITSKFNCIERADICIYIYQKYGCVPRSVPVELFLVFLHSFSRVWGRSTATRRAAQQNSFPSKATTLPQEGPKLNPKYIHACVCLLRFSSCTLRLVGL